MCVYIVKSALNKRIKYCLVQMEYLTIVKSEKILKLTQFYCLI